MCLANTHKLGTPITKNTQWNVFFYENKVSASAFKSVLYWLICLIFCRVHLSHKRYTFFVRTSPLALFLSIESQTPKFHFFFGKIISNERFTLSSSTIWMSACVCLCWKNGLGINFSGANDGPFSF